jgi:heat-inducible transcriptional repressor
MAATLLKHIEFVTLGEGKILVILVSNAGLVQRTLIRVADPYKQEELDRAGNYLSEKFSGQSLTQIRNELLRMMKEEREVYVRMLALFQAWQNSMETECGPEAIFVQGTVNILNKPEFADVERMRSLFEMFEEKSRLVQILNECICGQPLEGVNITIGSELGVPKMRDFTLITSFYAPNDHTVGFVGIFGPTRMEYERGISIVGYLGRLIGEMINA